MAEFSYGYEERKRITCGSYVSFSGRMDLGSNLANIDRGNNKKWVV
jgi:hypothetical protein